MTVEMPRSIECLPSMRPDDRWRGSQSSAPSVILEAYRLIDEARRALDCDVMAAHLFVVKLAQVLRAQVRNTPRGGLAPWQLRRVREHVATHLAERIPICDLAAIVRLSASHFTRAFRMSTGRSPHAFILRERMDLAKCLLRESAAPICEIALRCGLNDQAHLTRLFTRFEGLSPAAWRRHCGA